MTQVTQAPEATAEQAERWQREYQDGYRAGRGDARSGRQARENCLIDIPAERPNETGSQHVARYVDLAWCIGYTRAYLFEHPKYLGN